MSLKSHLTSGCRPKTTRELKEELQTSLLKNGWVNKKGEPWESADYNNLVAALFHRQFKFCRVGSSLIPSVENPQDYDILVLDNEEEWVLKYLVSNEYFPDGSEIPVREGEDKSDFSSYKKTNQQGTINVIVTKSEEFYTSFQKAVDICVEEDIWDKLTRIKVHNYMMNRGAKITDDEFVKIVQGGWRDKFNDW